MKEELYKMTKGKKTALVTPRVIYWSSMFVQQYHHTDSCNTTTGSGEISRRGLLMEASYDCSHRSYSREEGASCFRFCRRGGECLSSLHILEVGKEI